MTTLRFRGGLCVAAAVTCTAPLTAQLVVGAAPGGQIWNVDPSGAVAPALLASGGDAEAWGMTYDRNTNTLYWVRTGNAQYWLFKAVYSPAGLSPQLVAFQVLPAGGSFMGLAFDSGASKLYAAMWIGTQTTIYELSTVTAAATFVAALPAGFYFSGFEYDAARDRFLGTSGTTSAQVNGLFQIEFRTGAPWYVELAYYPVVESLIDGLAVSNDRAYLVNADGPIYVIDLDTGLYLPHLSSPLTGSGCFNAGAAYITSYICYANCDDSTAPPILNVADFTCFLNSFASGSLYANCDNSTAQPVLNVQDFVCFLNRFGAGCS